jgi:hypothetical protein
MGGKTAQLQIRVSPADKARLRQEAQDAGVDVSTLVLQRALPAPATAFTELASAAASADSPTYALAALHDLLVATPRLQLPELVAQLPEAARRDAWLANYLADMVETRCAALDLPVPAWTREVLPLPTPWFATTLRGLRPWLLRTAPVAFRRRNLFVDSTVGARV